ncbi:MAG: hypothetical protein BHW65_08785 [Verrucomicrobia bacterium CAG:312_58_20]|nr:MAG: hypothetical protein BHW65_08785 [Verrucomicrobia bacterium CAG:312_58_20]PWL65326.1 MAG: alkaline phosphatase [Verrucomicrobiota bacterium]
MAIPKIILSLAAFAVSAAALAAQAAKPVKYVFLFIGDGMSIPQRMTAEELARINTGKGLAINSMPHQALTTTRSANSFITDSAASGTAIACGSKTNNGMIGMDPKGGRLKSVAEVARDSGRKVGILTSVTLNHATPAAFYGHNRSRGNYYDLGLDLVESGFDFFGGGGIAECDDKKAKSYKGDIYEIAEGRGYTVVRKDMKALAALKPGCGKVIATGADGALMYNLDAPDSPRIADFTKKAIELLDNERGFFIMVEGGKIDWMCHANDAATVMAEVADFDNAVKVALEFARKNPRDTLVVVTGDHETGGLTMGFAGTAYNSYIDRLNAQKRSREAFNSASKKLAGGGKDIEFEDVIPLLSESFGFVFDEDSESPLALSEAERGELEKAFGRWKKDVSKGALSLAAAKILNNKAGLAWTSDAHTALPVETSAQGAGAEVFSGTIDNTDIAKILKELVR